MIRKKIRGGLWVLINLKDAKTGIAKRETNVKKHIIKSKNFTIQTNIKPSFVHHSLKKQVSVNMEIFARSLIQNQRFLLNSSTSFQRIQISTCSILRLSGALTMRTSINEINVSMLTIGKIFEGNPSCIITQRSSAVTGGLKNTSVTIETAAKMNTDAIILMDGRSLSITLKITSSINAKMERAVSNLTVLIIIQNRKKDCHCRRGSVFFQKPAQSPSHQIIICLT